MAYRYGRDSDWESCDSDSSKEDGQLESDEDGQLAASKQPRLAGAKDKGDGKAGANAIWANVLAEERLATGLCDASTGLTHRSHLVIQRDVESYERPEIAANEAAAAATKDGKRTEELDAEMDAYHKSGPVAEDDSELFAASTADVESFGVAADSKQSRKRPAADSHRHQQQHRRGSNNYRGRGGGRLSAKAGGDGRGRSANNKPHPVIPHVELDPDVEPGMLVDQLVELLHEQNKEIMTTVVSTLGAGRAIALLRQTEDVESAGGMLIINGQRRRTPGGVFLQLLKNDAMVTQEEKKLIFADSHAEERQMKKARRRLDNIQDHPAVPFEQVLEAERQLLELKRKKRERALLPVAAAKSKSCDAVAAGAATAQPEAAATAKAAEVGGGGDAKPAAAGETETVAEENSDDIYDDDGMDLLAEC